MKQNKLFNEMCQAAPFLAYLPFQSIEGNTLCYQRKKLGFTDEFETVSSKLSAHISDAEVNTLLSLTRGYNEYIRAAAIQSKAKALGRLFASKLVKSEHSHDFEDLGLLCKQQIEYDNVDMSLLTKMLGKFIVPENEYDKYFFLVSGSVYNELLQDFYCKEQRGEIDVSNYKTELSTGATTLYYRGAIIFRNDYIQDYYTPKNVWQKFRMWLSTKSKYVESYKPDTSLVYAGRYGNEECTRGVSGLKHVDSKLPTITDLGTHPSRDAEVYRLKNYIGLALWDENDLLCAKVKLAS